MSDAQSDETRFQEERLMQLHDDVGDCIALLKRTIRALKEARTVTLRLLSTCVLLLAIIAVLGTSLVFTSM